MCGGGGGNDAAEQSRADEQARQGEIRRGTQRIDNQFRQFDDNFYKGRRDAYTAFANPQLQDQYGDAGEQLTYSLARSGTMDSSIRAKRESQLQKLYDLRAQEIAGKALDYEKQARNSVEDARGDLIRTLTATADSGAAGNQAITRAQALTKPDQFDPLTNLFTDFTNTLGMQAAQERAEAASGGQYKARYNTGLFGPSRNAVKVT